jgi:hypothetical protein
MQNVGQLNARNAAVGVNPPAGFSGRAPSQAWEQIALADVPGAIVWAWFKPPAVPHGLMLHVPDEAYQVHPQPKRLTLRNLLQAAGVDADGVALWQLGGFTYDMLQGAAPLLDQPIPRPVPGVDPTIVVYLHAAPALPAPAWGMAPAGPEAWAAASAGPVATGFAGPVVGGPQGALDMPVAELFDHIETDWSASLQVEQDLIRLRKQLVDMMARLKTLNRDLTATERLHSSPQDQKDWQDARRWLRDAATQLSVCIREHDIGDTSAAGQRKWFEQMYEQFVVGRIPFEGMQQAQRDYETYRKMIQTLSMGMHSALMNAALNGERRAQQVLNRIAAKVREATTRKNALGVLLD